MPPLGGHAWPDRVPPAPHRNPHPLSAARVAARWPGTPPVDRANSCRGRERGPMPPRPRPPPPKPRPGFGSFPNHRSRDHGQGTTRRDRGRRARAGLSSSDSRGATGGLGGPRRRRRRRCDDFLRPQLIVSRPNCPTHGCRASGGEAVSNSKRETKRCGAGGGGLSRRWHVFCSAQAQPLNVALSEPVTNDCSKVGDGRLPRGRHIFDGGGPVPRGPIDYRSVITRPLAPWAGHGGSSPPRPGSCWSR